MPELYILFSAFIGIAFGSVLIYYSFKKFEVAIFLMAFSPWVPYMFLQNAQEGMMREEADITSYIRVGLIIIVGFVSLVKFIQYWPRHKGRLPVHFALLAVFLVIAFLSTVYSIDVTKTIIRSVTFVAVFFFLLGLFAWLKEEEQLHKLLNTVYTITLVYIVLTFIGLVVMPGRMWWWNETSRFIGIWGHPNTTGIFCLSAYPVLFWKYSESASYKKRIFIGGLIVLVLLMHVLTGSRSSLAASVVGISIWFIMQRKGFKTVLMLVVVAIGVITLLELNPESLERKNSGKITDLTGRDEFWKNAAIVISEKPIAGHGYAVEGKVWADPRFFKEGYHLWSGSSRTSVHNGYISVLIGLGFIGLIVWLAVLLWPYLKVIRHKPSSYKSYIFAIMAAMLVVNFAESALDAASHTGAVYFWFAWIVAGKLKEIDLHEEADDVEEEEENEEEVELMEADKYEV